MKDNFKFHMKLFSLKVVYRLQLLCIFTKSTMKLTVPFEHEDVFNVFNKVISHYSVSCVCVLLKSHLNYIKTLLIAKNYIDKNKSN